jgi:putative transposase
MQIKTYQFKLYRSKRNRKLNKWLFLSAEIYNHCISLHKRYYKLFKVSLNIYKLQKHITKLKQQEKYKHWYSLSADAIQTITERIDRAYKLFYRNLKRGIKTAPPGFKKRINYKSFTLKQSGYKFLNNNSLLIQKQKYKYYKSREIEGKIKTVTIKKNAIGDFYIYITCEVDIKLRDKATPGKIAGLDFGLKTYLISSDNEKIESPLFFKQSRNKLRKLNQALSSKKKGSKNRKKAKRNLARVHIDITNKRKDFQFKLANSLCKQYDKLFIEDLNLKGMQRLYGRKISDLAHGNFISILKYVSTTYKDTEITEIDRWFPSSKTCNDCGFVYADLKLSEREWICPNCKSFHDRDFNAAKNILNYGVRALTPNGGTVRPRCLASADDVKIPV